MNVIKTDINGNVTWNYIYNMPDASTSGWLTNGASGRSLIEYDNGYRLVGVSNGKGFMVQTDKNGLISGTVGKQVYSVAHPTRPHNYLSITLDDIKKSASGHLAVTGYALDHQDGANIDQDALILHFDGTNPANSFTLVNTTLIDAWTNQIPGSDDLAKAVFLEYLSAYDVFAVPVFSGALGAASNAGGGEVEIRFYNSDFNTQSQILDYNAGNYKAFDLRMGIVEVSNGFATVSTIQPNGQPTSDATVEAILQDRYPNTTPSSGDCQAWFDINTRNEWMKFWDSDASVARYEIDQNLTVTKKWERTFDVEDGEREREFFPGDIKRQECLYGITVDDFTEAIVISGNTSSNFDDSYLAKLYSDDCSLLNYDIFDYLDNVVEIESNTTWDTSKTVIGHVIIESGNTLTISGENTIIRFAGYESVGVASKIVIEAGAKLIVDNATLTNDARCATAFWEGIEVYGDNDYDQTDLSKHGMLVLKNGAVIEKSRGITVNTPSTWGAGGLIRASNTTFKDCKRAVAFYSYPFNNKSYFRNCTFELTPEFVPFYSQEPNGPFPQVTLWDNRGVRFLGCSFVDNSGINVYDGYAGKGIYSVDAGFTVKELCTYPSLVPPSPCPSAYRKRSSFENFNIGIHATGSATSNTVSIDKTDFINNAIATKVDGLDQVRFTANDVEIGGLTKQGFFVENNYYSGFVSNQASGFNLEGNTFEGVDDNEPTAGVNIVNSGQVANLVYRSTYKDLTIGEKYDGTNKNWYSSFEGLVFECNQNPVSNQYDVEVNLKSNNFIIQNYEGIRSYQGRVNNLTSAGNTFSPNPTESDGHIRNTSMQGITYLHSNSGDVPTHVTPIFVGLSAVTNSNNCPDLLWKLNDDGQTEVPMSTVVSFYQGIADYNGVLYNYHQFIDNGNTDSLLNTIDLYFPTEAQQMRDDLMNQAPFVSQAVLMDAAMSGILTDALLLEVCLANPDATKDEAFLDFLEFQIPNPLPPQMIQAIYQNWDAETPRTALEGQLAELNTQIGLLQNNLLHHYQVDTLHRMDSIEKMHEMSNTLNSQYRLVEIAIEQEDFSSTQNLLQDIANNHTFTQHEQDLHNAYVSYRDLRQSVANQSRTIFELTTGEKNALTTMANDNLGRVTVFAQNILCFVYQECYSSGDGPQQRIKRSRIYTEKKEGSAALSDDGIQLNPNPANKLVEIKLESWEKGISYEIQIHSMEGKMVLHENFSGSSNTINVAHLQSGVYLYTLYEEDSKMSSGKLIIQH